MLITDVNCTATELYDSLSLQQFEMITQITIIPENHANNRNQ